MDNNKKYKINQNNKRRNFSNSQYQFPPIDSNSIKDLNKQYFQNLVNNNIYASPSARTQINQYQNANYTNQHSENISNISNNMQNSNQYQKVIYPNKYLENRIHPSNHTYNSIQYQSAVHSNQNSKLLINPLNNAQGLKNPNLGLTHASLDRTNKIRTRTSQSSSKNQLTITHKISVGQINAPPNQSQTMISKSTIQMMNHPKGSQGLVASISKDLPKLEKKDTIDTSEKSKRSSSTAIKRRNLGRAANPKIKCPPFKKEPEFVEIEMIMAKKTKDDLVYYECKRKGHDKEKSQWVERRHMVCDHLIDVFNESLPKDYKIQYCISEDKEGFEITRLPDNIVDFIIEMSKDDGPLISVSNEVDSCGLPKGFECIRYNKNPKGIPNLGAESTNECTCINGCTLEFTRKCICHKYNNSFYSSTAYDINGLLLLPPRSCIIECTNYCKCPITCINRVVQRGRDVKLQIFKTVEKGWGVRALEIIPKGKFISEYRGELIDGIEAEKRGKMYDTFQSTYLFDLDFFHFEHNEDSNYIIDAYHYGNVSRFFNHSCDPNLVTHSVFTEGYKRPIYKLAFFATRDIMIGEELCFDYQPGFSEYEELNNDTNSNTNINYSCKCESEKCRKNIHL